MSPSPLANDRNDVAEREQAAARLLETGADRTRSAPVLLEAGVDRARSAPLHFEAGADRTRSAPVPFEAGVDRKRSAPVRFETGADRTRSAPVLYEALTAREHEVLVLVADGLRNKEVAERLGVSAHTVKFHLAAIFGKLGAASRTEAVRRSLQLGLIHL